jgi:hypothetical protein
MIPYTDYECRLALDELYRGDKVVLPSSMEHAEFMLKVAQAYINQHRQELVDVLAGK